MRQRAAAAATPPRSADSDQSWQNQHHNQARHRGSTYQSGRREEPIPYGTVIGGGGGNTGAESPPHHPGQDSHAPRRRRHHHHHSGNNPAPLHNSTNTKNHHYQTTKEEQQRQQQQLLHSPQHYLSEYNKNYGIDLSANAIASAGATTTNASDQPTSLLNTAPRSTGAVNTSSSYLLRSHSQRDVGVYDPNATASDVYYAQYANHSPQYHHHHHHPYSSQYHQSLSYGDNTSDNRPTNLRRHNSAGNANIGLHQRTTNAHKASFQHFEATFHLDPNPIAAVHFRKALHVPDKQYREYLHGRARQTTPILNPICCANVCAGFSLVGFVFLFFIGILLDTQPLYIGGTLPSATKENDSGKTSTIYFMVNERLPMASNAYQTSYVYLATALVCLMYVYYERLDTFVKHGRRSGYQDVPDHHDGTISDVVGVIDGDDGGGGGPDGGGGGGVGDPTKHAAYQMSNRNRFETVFASGAIRMREWAGNAAARIWNGRQRGTHRGKPRSKACAKTV